MKSHAWLCVEQAVVVGGETMNDFTPVATYTGLPVRVPHAEVTR